MKRMHEISNPSQLRPAEFFVVSLQVKHFKTIQGIRVWDCTLLSHAKCHSVSPVHNSGPD